MCLFSKKLSYSFIFFCLGALIDIQTKNDAEKRKNLGVKFLLCFSLYGNGKKLLSTKKSAGTIGCINGIRFFSMAWVVLGHSFYSGTLIPWKNTFAIADVKCNSRACKTTIHTWAWYLSLGGRGGYFLFKWSKWFV